MVFLVWFLTYFTVNFSANFKFKICQTCVDFKFWFIWIHASLAGFKFKICWETLGFQNSNQSKKRYENPIFWLADQFFNSDNQKIGFFVSFFSDWLDFWKPENWCSTVIYFVVCNNNNLGFFSMASQSSGIIKPTIYNKFDVSATVFSEEDNKTVVETSNLL